MNITAITGRLTRDPEVRVTAGQNATTIARYTLAVERDRKVEGQPEADFINCVAFGKTAEFIEKYFSKGMKMEVQGRWQTGSFKKDDGTTVYTNDCVAEKVKFAESKSAGMTSSKPEVQEDVDGFMSFDGDIPESVPFN